MGHHPAGHVPAQAVRAHELSDHEPEDSPRAWVQCLRGARRRADFAARSAACPCSRPSIGCSEQLQVPLKSRCRGRDRCPGIGRRGMKLYFDDVAFDGQLQRSVGKADAGMANVGECLAIAEQISRATATAGIRRGPNSRRGSSPAATRRAAPATASAPATSTCAQRSTSGRRSSFTAKISTPTSSSARSPRACRRFAPPWSCLTTRPGPCRRGLGLPLQPGRRRARPTILHIGGYDSTAEELYASVPAALDRGYAFAAIDGPGPGSDAL